MRRNNQAGGEPRDSVIEVALEDTTFTNEEGVLMKDFYAIYDALRPTANDRASTAASVPLNQILKTNLQSVKGE